MRSDILDLKEFYATPLGLQVERSIAMALSTLWDDAEAERIVGFGYALPWLDRFSAGCERVFALMPAAQGATPWPSRPPYAAALISDQEWPLADAAVDRILMVHGLEHSDNPRETLMEAWRVLVPGGRLILVVPHRRGLWARFEHTPFGTGRPWSRSQLNQLLRDTNFTPDRWSDALHFPPSPRSSILRFHQPLERVGRRFWPIFSGVVMVEARKLLLQGRPVQIRSTRSVLVPVATAQGA